MRRFLPLAVGAAAVAAALVLSACQSSPDRVAAQTQAQGWQQLDSQVGRYRADTDFLQQGLMADRLRQLTGDRHAIVLRNLEVAGPLRQEGQVYFVTGNRQHEGGRNAAAVALDARSQTMRVWLLHEGRAIVMEDPGAQFTWPAEVRRAMGNAP